MCLCHGKHKNHKTYIIPTTTENFSYRGIVRNKIPSFQYVILFQKNVQKLVLKLKTLLTMALECCYHTQIS